MQEKKSYIKKEWKKNFGTDLNLNNPITYNEKLQWEKIYSYNELAQQCADKLKVLDYVKNNIGEQYIKKPIKIYGSIKEINFEELPNKFVIKANHDSGSVLVVKDKNNIDYTKLKFLEMRLKINYGCLSKEWIYDNIKPKLFVEEYLESEDGKDLKDYKVFCFNGEPKLIQVDLERFKEHKRNFYDLEWNRLDLAIQYPNANYDVKKPKLLDEMLKLSSILSKPFNHVRVDWFIYRDKLLFGEMTFFHGSGFERFNSYEWERRMGSWFEVSKDLEY